MTNFRMNKILRLVVCDSIYYNLFNHGEYNYGKRSILKFLKKTVVLKFAWNFAV